MVHVVYNLSFTSLFLLLQLSARSVPFPAPDFSTEISGSGKSRQLPNGINCSDCKQHLSNRIRQMQRLHRMKEHIMTAIRKNGNHVPTPETARAIPRVKEDRKVMGRSQGVSAASELSALWNASDSAQPLAPSDASSRKGSRQQKPSRGQEHGEKDRRPTNSGSPNKKGSPAGPDPVRTSLQGREGSEKGERSRTTVIETEGPNIVSFSRVVSSGKRKHILQFTLKPMAPGQNLEVVKAHLWLLLTRHDPDADNKQQTPDVVDEVKVAKRSKRAESLDMLALTREERLTAELQPNVPNDQEIYSGGALDMLKEKEQGGREKRSPSQPKLVNESSSEHQSRSSRRDESHKNINQVTNLNVDPENEDKDSDERFQAVLRILLLADNGTRTLMTYLRTNVRVTHWQKVRLPVSVIQHQLQSSQTTLTLLIRCRRCGDAVRIVLPKRRRRSRRRERRKRRRKDKKGKGNSRREKKKRHHKRRKRRHGVPDRERRRRRRVNVSGKGRKRQFRPLPFLVINTRLRSSRKPQA